MRAPPIPFLLLLLCAVARADDAIVAPLDFKTFCVSGFHPGTLSTDETVCTMEIAESVTSNQAAAYCGSRHFSGKLQQHRVDSFTCTFQHKLVCRSGYFLIQSNCYKIVSNKKYSEREAACQQSGKGEVVDYVTPIMTILLTHHMTRVGEYNAWLKPFGSESSRAMLLHTSRFYTSGGELRRAERGTFSGAIDPDNDAFNVICVHEPTKTFASLENWCDALRELRLRSQYNSDKKVCLYITYNHYPVKEHAHKLIDRVKGLHDRCQMFKEHDFIPLEESLFKDNKLTILNTGHPVRVAGASRVAHASSQASEWRMVTSDGANSNVDKKMWLGGKPRGSASTAEGGAYTLGIVRHEGRTRYTDLPPFTPLPVLCAATINKQETTALGCNCPSTSICTTTGGEQTCACKDASYTDKYQEFVYKIGKQPAPRGKLCYKCGESTLIVLFSYEECANIDHYKSLIENIYDRFFTPGFKMRLIVIAYQLSASVVLDERYTAYPTKAHILAKMENIRQLHYDAKRDMDISTDEELMNQIYNHGTRRHTEYSSYFYYRNLPYRGLKLALDVFNQADIRDTKKHVIMYAHHPMGPLNHHMGSTINYLNSEFGGCTHLNLDEFHKQNQIKAYKALMNSHPDLEFYVVHAPQLQNTPEYTNSYSELGINKNTHLFVQGLNANVRDFTSLALAMEDSMCAGGTDFDGINEFERK